MSYANNLQAMEVWRRLKAMDEADAKAKARDEGSEMNEVWATAQVAGMVLNSLDMRAESEDLILWTKLYGRSLAKVYAHYLYQKKQRPEQRVHALSRFAAQVKPLDAALDDLLPHVREEVA